MRSKEFTKQVLSELAMTPKQLIKQASVIPALIGMEFEMYVPGAAVADEKDLEQVEDFSHNIRTNDIDGIVSFFNDSEMGLSTRDEFRLRKDLQEKYSEYIEKEIADEWKKSGFEYYQEEIDPDDIPEDQTVEEYWNDHSSSATRLRSRIHERFSEEKQADPPSEREWLRDSDMSDMREVCDEMGIGWPYWTTEESDDPEWDLEDVAQSFSEAVGRTTEVEGSNSGGSYVLTTDGSLSDPQDPADAGLEFISPPLSIADMLSDLEKVRVWAGMQGCYTTEETGLHINVSIKGANWDQLDYVKLAIMMGDKWVLSQFGRLTNIYTASAMDNVMTNIENNPDVANELLQKMKEHMNAIASRSIHQLTTAKYTSAGLKLDFEPDQKRVEFRSAGGDWLDKNFSMIENSMLRFVVALNSALDPNADRKEYLSKLYKLIAPSGASDAVQIFAKFAAGDLPRSALVSFVRQLQRTRRMEKEPAARPENEKAWYKVSMNNGSSIEVAAMNKIDAFDVARKEWGPEAANLHLSAKWLRPYA